MHSDAGMVEDTFCGPLREAGYFAVRFAEFRFVPEIAGGELLEAAYEFTIGLVRVADALEGGREEWHRIECSTDRVRRSTQKQSDH